MGCRGDQALDNELVSTIGETVRFAIEQLLWVLSHRN